MPEPKIPAETLYPPQELQDLAERQYQSDQRLHRHHISCLVDRAAEPFERLSIERTGDCLLRLQAWLAREYFNKPKTLLDKPNPQDLEEDHFTFFIKHAHIGFEGNVGPITTYFTFNIFNDGFIIDEVSVDYAKRGLFNFLTTHRLTEQNDVFISLTDFVERAEKYAQIKLPSIKDNTLRDIYVASTQNMGGNECINKAHNLAGLLYHSEESLAYLKDLYRAFLNIIYDTSESKDKRIQAIFLLCFLVGSNPLLISGRGGAFQADFLLQHLLVSIGEPPMRKNFLDLTEVVLLQLYASDNQADWRKPLEMYQEALRGQTNILFHPGEKAEPLIAMVEDTSIKSTNHPTLTENEFFHINIVFQCYQASLLHHLRSHQEARGWQAIFFHTPTRENHTSDTLITPEIIYLMFFGLMDHGKKISDLLNNYIKRNSPPLYANDTLPAQKLVTLLDEPKKDPNWALKIYLTIKKHSKDSKHDSYAKCLTECLSLCHIDPIDDHAHEPKPLR